MGRLRGRRASTRKAFGVGEECGIEHDGAALDGLGDAAMVHVVGRAKAERAMTVLEVVPVKKGPAVRPCVFDMPEAVREMRAVLERFENEPRRRDCRWRRAAASVSW